MPKSVFAKYEEQNYPFRFRVGLHLETIAGGVPSNPKVAEGFLKTKISDHDDLIRAAVAETMVERGIDEAQAVEEVDRLRHLNGFRRDEKGLHIGGYQLKAGLKWLHRS